MRTAAICPTCATYENAKCVLYNGPYLSNIGVEPLDSVEIALQKINGNITPSPFDLDYIEVEYEGVRPTFAYASIPSQKISYYGYQINAGTLWTYLNGSNYIINETYAPGLTSLTFPNLEGIAGSSYYFTLSYSNILNISLPVLKASFTGFSITRCSFLENINLNQLEFVTSLSIYNNPSVSTLELPSLKYVQYLLDIDNMASITTLDLSSLVQCAYISIYNNPLLEELTLSESLLGLNYGINANGNALTQSCVDNILVRLAALDGTNGTTSFDNGPVTLNGGTNAAPSAIGLAAKAILEGRGCTVTTN